MNDEEVKRYLAEQLGDRDSETLPGFNLRDISKESLRGYRQLYANREPGHPWHELDDLSFLEQIGGARRDRATDTFNLTVAGLLMFGTHPMIQEKFPNYMLDYQDHSQPSAQTRWSDRVTLDGSWSGNLFDFQRRVSPKLVAGLKTPFQLEGDIRIDETAVHVALREAHRKRLLDLIKTSGGGATISRGTMDQKGVQFRVQHIFWVAAVEDGIRRIADVIGVSSFKPGLDKTLTARLNPAIILAFDQGLLSKAALQELKSVTPKRQAEILKELKQAKNYGLDVIKGLVLATPSSEQVAQKMKRPSE